MYCGFGVGKVRTPGTEYPHARRCETGTLRNINILAGEAHWRQPKCPDGASADQVPADYRERRNHPCADCRCRVSHRRTNGAKESDRADELRGAGRAGRKRTTRAAASAATSFLLPPSPAPSLVRPRLTLITHSGHGVVRHS